MLLQLAVQPDIVMHMALQSKRHHKKCHIQEALPVNTSDAPSNGKPRSCRLARVVMSAQPLSP